jgi:hypothetical protein
VDDAGQALLTAFAAGAIAFLVIFVGILLILAIRLVRDPSVSISGFLAGLDPFAWTSSGEGAAHPMALPRLFAVDHDRRRRIRNAAAVVVSVCAFVAVVAAVLTSIEGRPPTGPGSAGQAAGGSLGQRTDLAVAPSIPAQTEPGATAGSSASPGPTGALAGVTATPGATVPGSEPTTGTDAQPGSGPPAPGASTTPPGGVPGATTPSPAPTAAPTPTPGANPTPTPRSTPPPTPAPTPAPTPTSAPTPTPPEITNFTAHDQLLLIRAQFDGQCVECTEWTIAFGDGQSTGWRTGPISATHDYSASGTYTARLTVRGTGGEVSDTEQVQATIPL